MDIKIRPATLSDAFDMAEVYSRSWEVAYKDFIPADYILEKRKRSVSQMERMLNDESLRPFQYIILCEGATIGSLTVAYCNDEDLDDTFYEVWGIYLHPDYFRKGVGSQAMDFAYEIARGLGKTNMSLWVFQDNDSSIKFYDKCGFVADGKTKILNCGKPLTAIRMRKSLIA